MRRGLPLLLLTAWFVFSTPQQALGQSLSFGTIAGSVQDRDRNPVGGALVTVSTANGGALAQARTGPSGNYELRSIQPGVYQLRIEAIGFRPIVGLGLVVRGGDRVTTDLTLLAATPPIVSADTVSLANATGTRLTGGGTRVGPPELDGLPRRTEDLAQVARLSTSFDETLGSLGLPGSSTQIVIDGVPFYTADHPTTPIGATPIALLPASALGGVTMLHNPMEAEWGGGAGGTVAVSTRSSTADAKPELSVSADGSPLWSSSELSLSPASFTSFYGSGRAGVEIRPQTARLFVTGSAERVFTPRTPLAPMALTASLSGIDPDLLTAITDPSLDRYTRISGSARVDVSRSSQSRLFFRGLGTYVERTAEELGPAGPLAGAALPESGFDFSFASGYFGGDPRGTVLDLKGGISGSYREFGHSNPAAAPAYLLNAASSLGALPSITAESSRTDITLAPTWLVNPAQQNLRFGASLRASQHRMAHSYAQDGDFVFADESALLAGRGYARTTSPAEESFSTLEFGGFGEYGTVLAPGLVVRFSGRYDNERIPMGDVESNAGWFALTGLVNDSLPRRSMNQFGARAGFTWESPEGSGPQVDVNWSYQTGNVDPRHWFEVNALDVGATSTTFAGTGFGWPGSAAIPGSATQLETLTLLGPDTRAPQTSTLTFGLTQRLTNRVTAHVAGAIRRTDFLMRRRNLNLPAFSGVVDQDGRTVYGTLAQDGGLLTATAADSRRFPTFGPVWALDPDGWSKYQGFTLGLESSGRDANAFASYTYSETTDNWIGASDGSIDATLPPGVPGQTWDEGVSDFDTPHRVVAGVSADAGPFTISSVYTFASGRPFTPRFRTGVDANGDGSIRNDVAYVPGDTQLASLVDAWPCLQSQAAGFAVRNSCRGPARHTLDVRLALALTTVGSRSVALTVDGLNLVESADAILDEALVLIDPAGTISTSPDGSVVTVPTMLNPDFGQVLYPLSPGRTVRIGLRIGS